MSEHLSDETLTDVLDGAVDADAHLAGCRACADRLADMRSVAALVAAAPPLPTPEARDEAVRRALVAASASTPRRLSTPAAWMAIAAAVVVLLGTVAVAVAGRDHKSATTAALRESTRKSATADQGAGAQVATMDAGDLGDQRDAAALHALLEARLSGGDTATVGASGGAASSPGPAQDSSAPFAASGTSEVQPAAPAAAAAPRCLAQARAAGSGRLGALVLTGRLRWRGQPAVVLVFASGEQGQLARRAFVMAQRDCQLLVVQSF